ncbi:tetratricopeptide repeat protein [Capnocytophaga gingivalis]|uniref:tetratricopeptide repeat protein n=1 Tax=Capnocytophaga gingivalis TaxID=1017 RepID=UPI003C787378
MKKIGVVILNFLLFSIGSAQERNWHEEAEQGNTNAQAHLGYRYYTGKGKEQSYSRAAYWMEKAAEKGEVLSQERLGYMYYNGLGVERSYSKAVYWWSKAATYGLAEAQGNLGYAYYMGHGVEKDKRKAIYWLRKACENFDDRSCEMLNKINN